MEMSMDERNMGVMEEMKWMKEKWGFACRAAL